MIARTLVVSIGIFCGGFAHSQTPSLQDTQYLLLENGQMVSGSLEIRPSKIIVIKPSGSRIVFPREQVASTAKSKSEIYWLKVAALSPTDIQGHTSLFRWCLDNEIFREAQNQIDILFELPIPARRLNRLNQSLDNAIQINAPKNQNNSKSDLANRVVTDRNLRLVNFESLPVSNKSIDFFHESDGICFVGKHFFIDDLIANVSPEQPPQPNKAPNHNAMSRIPTPSSAPMTDSENTGAFDPFDPEVFNNRYRNKNSRLKDSIPSKSMKASN